MVTGLVITSRGNISIGRGKKREIKSMIYRFTQDKLDKKKTAYLRGFLSFVNAVEPTFLKALKRKYGLKIINKILKSDIVKRK